MIEFTEQFLYLNSYLGLGFIWVIIENLRPGVRCPQTLTIGPRLPSARL